MQKKWWLCYATDFQSLMYPCFICCRIFGIFPYKFNTSTFEISKPRHILSTVVICVCCVINLSFIYDIISKMYLGEVTINLHFLIYYVTCSSIVISTNILSVPRMRLLQTILEISSKVPQESYQKLSRFIHVKDILGITLKFVQIYTNFSKIQKLQLNFFLIAVVRTYFALLVYQTNMLYINCVCILKACLKNINDNLMHMQRLKLNNTKICIPMFIYRVQKKQLLLMELKNLRKRHLIIGNAVQKLNIIFSLQLLATLVMTLSAITFALYFRVIHWQNGIFISLDKHFLDVLSASLIYNFVIIILLIWACETGKNQAQEISTTIYDLFNSTNDKKIKYEVVKL
ncbi:uncharacterized protein LOC114254596 [Monomorium pharaonis]|uniref:uncharacterized protein LOC114254596 n=1 Tax=Monomorium pharaonis TaxID=307658 RepID=UPI001747B6C8|nr:uncharacterized protein LOC114254596 [Monomorium pharaonis]